MPVVIFCVATAYVTTRMLYGVLTVHSDCSFWRNRAGVAMATFFHISWISKESSSFVHPSGIVTWTPRLKTASAATKTSFRTVRERCNGFKISPMEIHGCLLSGESVWQRALLSALTRVTSNDVTSTWCREQFQFRFPEIMSSNSGEKIGYFDKGSS